MRWSRAARTPSLIRRRRVGWPTSRQANGERLVHVVVGEHADAFELVVVEQVGLVDDQDGGAAAFVVFGGEGVGGLGDRGWPCGCGEPAEGGDDGVVDAAGADGGVAEVDDGVPGGVEAGEGGADGDGLAGADLAGDHAEGAFADAPGDAGDGFGVAAVAVQHAGGEVPAEGHAGEAVVGLQSLDAQSTVSGRARGSDAGRSRVSVRADVDS